MDLLSAGLASIGFTQSRAFLPVFVAAVLMRVFEGNATGEMASSALMGVSGLGVGMPGWFTSDWCLGILGLLAFVEFMAQRNDDARELMGYVDQYFKPVMAVVMLLGLISPADAAAVKKIATEGGIEKAGLVMGTLVGAVAMSVAAITFVMAQIRSSLLTTLYDADPDNSTGIHSLMAWAEDAWAVFGVVLLLIFPVLIAVLVGVGLGVMVYLRKRAERKEEASKTTCGHCGGAVYKCAVICPTCKTLQKEIKAINWLGATTDQPGDVEGQPFALACKRRCPQCATRLERGGYATGCSGCGREPFADGAFVRAYDARVSARLPVTLLACAGLGIIPIAGLVAGILVYRVQLVQPYRAWIPTLPSLMMRWGLRVLIFLLMLLHLIPFAGLLALPTMALLNYLAYRSMFLANVERAENEKAGMRMTVAPAL